MAGRGPRPKDPARRVRHDSSGIAATILRFEGAEQPALPDDIPFPEHTVRWWAMWGASPQADNFGSTDWDFLLDTALVHADVWSGNLDRMSELRIRVAKFGATPEDRARLRMQFAEADAADKRRGPVTPNSRGRYGTLTAMPDASADAAG